METLNINKQALTNVLEEIFRERKKNNAKTYAGRLADRIFAKAKLAQFQLSERAAEAKEERLILEPLTPVRFATDAEVKELLGLHPIGKALPR